MPSILPDYEYDIFISYRHNDNRSGWVTEFVKQLNQELAATIKQPISVYFDSNPHDGLLETHSVDKSLEKKLKCLILIPILSQTYCDTKSFAWQHEFVAFNHLANHDQLGRDIHLQNGNVACRILPVKIHDLDSEDKSTIQNELATALRAIEFIYKEPGVNRPLGPADKRVDNQSKTDYRNQMNKLANAIKELIYGMVRPASAPKTKSSTLLSVDHTETKPAVAVLPFSNMSRDQSQEYFSDGITENIIMELAGNKALRIISRTSVMRYKASTQSVPEIAEELSVDYVLEGGVQIHGNKVRINVQLIDVVKDDVSWSKVFTESMDDIFEIQTQVAETVAKELKSSISGEQAKPVDEVPTKNIDAYNLFLKGRHAFNQWSVEGYKVAADYYLQAIALDPEFKLAYSMLASAYSARMSWNGDLSPAEAKPQIERYLEEAWKRGPSANDYLTKAFLEFFAHKNFESAEKHLISALEAGGEDSNVLYAYCYLLNMMGRFDEAQTCVDRAKNIDPLTVGYFNYQTINYYLAGQPEKALQTIDEGFRLYPSVLRFYDFSARIYLTIGQWEKARKAVVEGLQSSGLRPPSMVAFLAMANIGLGDDRQSKVLLEELISRSEQNEKGVNIYLVYVYAAFNDTDQAAQWLLKAKATNDVDLIWWKIDPLLAELRRQIDATPAEPNFKEAETFIRATLEKEMPQLPYHNYEHINDVVQAAEAIGKAESLNNNDLKVLKIAALLHDIGFIRSSKNHEAHGAEMAAEILPRFGFDAELITAIQGMILATKLPQSPANQLENILCDADLDYLGRDDFYPIGNKLFEEMKASGAVESEREWNLVQKTFLQSHKYHTDYGRTHREAEKQARLREVMDKLTNKA